jgi:cytochrome c
LPRSSICHPGVPRLDTTSHRSEIQEDIVKGLKQGLACIVGGAAFAVLLGSAGPARAADGDPIAGKAIFERTCQNCHSLEIGVNKVGPSLWRIVGRQPAAVDGFDYSQAMRSNKTPWDAAALNAYLADPRGDIHGVKMFFKGLPEARDRVDVIAYLTTVK